MTESGPGSASHQRPLRFVVRARGTWALAPIPAVDPVPVDVDGVLAELRSTADEELPEAPAVAPITARVVVVPAATAVGRVANGCLVMTGPDGTDVALDETDVRLLDALTSAAAPYELADRLGLDEDEVARGCTRLLVAGCAVREDGEPVGIPAAPEQPAAAAPPTATGPVERSEPAERGPWVRVRAVFRRPAR